MSCRIGSLAYVLFSIYGVDARNVIDKRISSSAPVHFAHQHPSTKEPIIADAISLEAPIPLAHERERTKKTIRKLRESSGESHASHGDHAPHTSDLPYDSFDKNAPQVFREEDWRSSVKMTQQACEADFSRLCDDPGMSTEVDGDADIVYEISFLNGWGMSTESYSETDLVYIPESEVNFFDGWRRLLREGHQHGGPHEGHRQGGSGSLRGGCGGPLGFGSKEADMCLRSQWDDLSPKCREAIEETEMIFRATKHRPPLDFMWIPIVVFLGCLAMYTCRRLRRCHGPKKMRAVLIALNKNPELKAQVEAIAGVPVPPPGWKRKVMKALNDHPELQASIAEVNDLGNPKSVEHPGVGCGRWVMRIFFTLLVGIITLSLMILLCGPLEGETSTEEGAFPLAGFLFSISSGFVIILVISFLIRCCKFVCCAQTPATSPDSNMSMSGEKKVIVYTGVPIEGPAFETLTRETEVDSDEEIPPLEEM